MQVLDSMTIGARQHWTPKGVAVGAAHFFIHFAEMWIAMMVGMVIFHGVAIPVLVSLGYAAVLDGTSAVHQVGMAVFMVAPMVGWMRLLGCTWRDGAEMSAAMLVPTLTVFVLCQLGAAEKLPWLNGFGGTAMLMGMLAVMLFRWRHYTSGMSIMPWRPWLGGGRLLKASGRS